MKILQSRWDLTSPSSLRQKVSLSVSVSPTLVLSVVQRGFIWTSAQEPTSRSQLLRHWDYLKLWLTDNVRVKGVATLGVQQWREGGVEGRRTVLYAEQNCQRSSKKAVKPPLRKDENEKVLLCLDEVLPDLSRAGWSSPTQHFSHWRGPGKNIQLRSSCLGVGRRELTHRLLSYSTKEGRNKEGRTHNSGEQCQGQQRKKDFVSKDTSLSHRKHPEKAKIINPHCLLTLCHTAPQEICEGPLASSFLWWSKIPVFSFISIVA